MLGVVFVLRNGEAQWLLFSPQIERALRRDEST
jgi:hypothetical protein